MGNTQSSGPYLAVLEKLSEYDQPKARELLEKYWDLDMEFGINADGLKLLLSSTQICADTDFVDSIMGSFPYQTLNVLDFIIGQGLMCKGPWEEKLSLVFDCIDFNRCEQVSFDELTILLLCAARGVLCLSGQLPELHPKTIKSADMEKHDRNVSKMLATDLGLEDGGSSADVTKEQFTAWFSKKCPNPESLDVKALVELCCAIVKDYSADLAKISEVRASNPGNRCVKYFDEEYFKSLEPPLQARLLACARTGYENPDSGLGCYAMAPDDYSTFEPFFDKVIRDYHGAAADAVHVTDWDASGVGENGVLDVTNLGLEELSMRVRVGRNLAKYNLPGAMDKEERIRFELDILKAFESLIANPEYGGTVYSLSPDHGEGIENPNLITAEKYDELVNAHVMFKDMDADPYLKSAGISSDWPYGRGCWQSEDKTCIIWFGEEDQLRIMCMKKGSRLNEIFDRLKQMLDVVEGIEGIEFARSEKYGYVTSCPSNLGTGMRASVHVKIPNLTADGTDTKAKEVAGPLGLSVRGTGGEHTPIGADGTVDISPRSRLFIKEAEIIAALYEGIKLLMAEENKLAAPAEEETPAAEEKAAEEGPTAAAEEEKAADTPAEDETAAVEEKAAEEPPAAASAEEEKSSAADDGCSPSEEKAETAPPEEPSTATEEKAEEAPAAEETTADAPVGEEEESAAAEEKAAEENPPASDDVASDAEKEAADAAAETAAAGKETAGETAEKEAAPADGACGSTEEEAKAAAEEAPAATEEKVVEEEAPAAPAEDEAAAPAEEQSPATEEPAATPPAGEDAPPPSTLKLTIHAAYDLKDADWVGQSDPRVFVCAFEEGEACPKLADKNEENARYWGNTPTIENNQNPIFDCEICLSLDGLKNPRIKLCVMDVDDINIFDDDNLEDLGQLDHPCADAECPKTKFVLKGGNEASSIEISYTKE